MMKRIALALLVTPFSHLSLRHVYGVGERKAADLGERFLAEIRGD
jgi:hypothetical protein